MIRQFKGTEESNILSSVQATFNSLTMTTELTLSAY